MRMPHLQGSGRRQPRPRPTSARVAQKLQEVARVGVRGGPVVIILAISKALAATLTAIALWGAACAWDNTSTQHGIREGGCHEANPGHLAQEAVGVGLIFAVPKRWRGPTIVVVLGVSAAAHALAANHNQQLITQGLCGR